MHTLILKFQSRSKYVERRHGEPFKFLFLPKMGLLGSQAPGQANTRKKSDYEL